MGFKRAYLCDGCGCEARCGLTNARCRHTTDESHATLVYLSCLNSCRIEMLPYIRIQNTE